MSTSHVFIGSKESIIFLHLFQNHTKNEILFAYFALTLKFSCSNNLILIQDINAALIKLKSIS